MNDATASPLDVLWTSGWDSTYIVLEAALLQARAVRPHYVLDPDRPSVRREIDTMRAIHDVLMRLEPAAAGRVAPLRLVDKADILADPRVDAWAARLAARTHVAPQYAWLSRYARTCAAPLALGIIRRSGGLSDIIDPELEDGPGGVRRLRRQVSDEAFELFRPFVFPTIELSKVEMRDRAHTSGFLTLLEMSWFCHEPRWSGDPCGICPPCHDARHQDMGWRLTSGAGWRGSVIDAAPGGLLKRVVRKVIRTLVP